MTRPLCSSKNTNTKQPNTKIEVKYHLCRRFVVCSSSLHMIAHATTLSGCNTRSLKLHLSSVVSNHLSSLWSSAGLAASACACCWGHGCVDEPWCPSSSGLCGRLVIIPNHTLQVNPFEFLKHHIT